MSLIILLRIDPLILKFFKIPCPLQIYFLILTYESLSKLMTYVKISNVKLFALHI